MVYNYKLRIHIIIICTMYQFLQDYRCSFYVSFQDYPVGLNFANEDEANKFKLAIHEKLEQRRQKRNGKVL